MEGGGGGRWRWVGGWVEERGEGWVKEERESEEEAELNGRAQESRWQVDLV